MSKKILSPNKQLQDKISRMPSIKHFYIGLQTELAFVESIEPVSLDEFAARICGSPWPSQCG